MAAIASSSEWISWLIEWRSSFRDYRGVVIAFHGDTIDAFSQTDGCKYSLKPKETLVVRVKPDCRAYLEYHYRALRESKFGGEMKEEEIRRELRGMLDSLPIGSKALLMEKNKAIELDYISKIIAESREVKDVGKNLRIAGSADEESVHEDRDDSDNEEEEGEEENSTEDDEDGEEDEEDEQEGSDDEEEEEEDGDSQEDETDGSDAVSEESIRIPDRIDLKIVVKPFNAVRGYTVGQENGLDELVRLLEKHYGSCPDITYMDYEGDCISVLAANDFLFALRSHYSQAPNKSRGQRIPALRFQAEFHDNGLPLKASARTDVLLPDAVAVGPSLSRPLVPTGLSIAGVSDTNVGVGSFVVDQTEQQKNAARPVTTATASRFSTQLQQILWQRGEVIGSGSFGEVYSGINLSTGERMAVKEVYISTGRRSKEQAKALQQEIKILSKLDHGNIVKYLGTECVQNVIRIFLELAPEGSVKDMLNEFGALSEPLIRRYALDILSGLAYLHSRKVIHRDVKPSNLLIANGIVKLADFGCSSMASIDSAWAGSQTDRDHGTVAGTTVYMAPEVMAAGENKEQHECDDADELQLTNGKSVGSMLPPINAKCNGDQGSEGYSYKFCDESIVNSNHAVAPAQLLSDSQRIASSKRLKKLERHVDKEEKGSKRPATGYGRKADVWSFGITLVELATGKAPFRSPAAAIYCICVSKEYPTFPDRMSALAHAMLERCLQEDPGARASCSELLDHEFLRGRPAFSGGESNPALSQYTEMNTAASLSRIILEPTDWIATSEINADEAMGQPLTRNVQTAAKVGSANNVNDSNRPATCPNELRRPSFAEQKKWNPKNSLAMDSVMAALLDESSSVEREHSEERERGKLLGGLIAGKKTNGKEEVSFRNRSVDSEFYGSLL